MLFQLLIESTDSMIYCSLLALYGSTMQCMLVNFVAVFGQFSFSVYIVSPLPC